ncbi:ribonuclease HIII [Candidatus Dojkabacteria bacterium]|nr:ribonuclease HIII [Candidatus Dojkabacteria bacterium]
MDEAKKVRDILLSLGWKDADINNEYIALRMKNEKGAVVTLYTSRKIVFQGKEDFTDIVQAIQGDSNVDFVSHIGVDEVGKGDYFGPLVVVSCFVDEEFFKKVKAIGVGDSKKFSDSRILKMYEEMKEYPYYYSSIVSPEEYNRLIKETGNVAILLAKQHSKVIEMALEDLRRKKIECKKVVIDQFSSKQNRVKDELGTLGKGVEFEQYHKGESDIAVACASVFARAIFLEEMEKMSNEYYFDFPKGASHVIEQGKEFVKRYGADELGKVAKVSFKTTRKLV